MLRLPQRDLRMSPICFAIIMPRMNAGDNAIAPDRLHGGGKSAVGRESCSRRTGCPAMIPTKGFASSSAFPFRIFSRATASRHFAMPKTALLKTLQTRTGRHCRDRRRNCFAPKRNVRLCLRGMGRIIWLDADDRNSVAACFTSQYPSPAPNTRPAGAICRVTCGRRLPRYQTAADYRIQHLKQQHRGRDG